MYNLGEIFKKIRNTKNLTLQEVAGEDFSVSMLSKFENGKTEISAEKLNKALSNMRVSIEEFYYLAQGLENDEFINLYSKSKRYKNKGNLEGLKKLYQLELNLFENKKYGKYHLLNSIIIANEINSLDEKFVIPKEHLKILHDYLFGIDMWGQYEMILMSSIVSFTNARIYMNYAREMIKNVDYLINVGSILNSVQIVVLHGLSLCIEEDYEFGVDYFYKKSKEYILGSRDVHMVIVFMFFEGEYYIYKGNIEKGKEKIEKGIEIFKSIGDFNSVNYYQKAYNNILKKLEEK